MSTEVFFTTCKKRKQKFNQVLVNHLKVVLIKEVVNGMGCPMSNKAVHSLSRVLSYLVNHECVHRIWNIQGSFLKLLKKAHRNLWFPRLQCMFYVVCMYICAKLSTPKKKVGRIFANILRSTKHAKLLQRDKLHSICKKRLNSKIFLEIHITFVVNVGRRFQRMYSSTLTSDWTERRRACRPLGP